MQFKTPDWAATPRRSHCVFLSVNGGKRWCVDEKSCYVIGRSPACDIPVEGKNVSRSHACIAHGTDGRLYVMDLGSVHGTFLNGERLEPSQKRQLDFGHVLRMADSENVFTLDGNEGEQPDVLNSDHPSQSDDKEEYDPFGDVGAEESSPVAHGVPIPAASALNAAPATEASAPNQSLTNRNQSEKESRGRGEDRGHSRDHKNENRRRNNRERECCRGRSYHAKKSGISRSGSDHHNRSGRRKEGRRRGKRDRSPRWRGRDDRRERRHKNKDQDGPHANSVEHGGRRKRQSAFSNEGAPVDTSADIVRSMMQAPGQNPVPTLGLSLEQKKELLWGKKKSVTETNPASASFGANRWDTAEFQSTEERSKFQRLMGVKGEGCEGVLDETERKVLAGEAQEEVLRSVEEHFVAGLRRADGRTVGLGL